ncbi:MAG: hypothetical protein QM754_06835 [Tepidisphaeraceae bacterium]
MTIKQAVVWVAMAAAPVAAFGADDESKTQRFDIRSPAGLDQLEREAVAIHAASPVMRRLDADYDGLPDADKLFEDVTAVPPELVQKTQKKVLQEFRAASPKYRSYLASLNLAASSTAGILSIESADALLVSSDLPAMPKQAQSAPTPSTEPASAPLVGRLGEKEKPIGLKIRSDETQLRLAAEDAKPATLSYSHDYNAGADQWVLNGIVAWVDSSEEQTYDNYRAVLLQADRTTNSKDATKDVNVLALKALLEQQVAPSEESPLFGEVRAYYRLTPFIVSDFDFKSFQAGFDAAAGPLIKDWGIGQRQPIKPLSGFFKPGIIWQPEMSLGYRHVFDDGDIPALQTQDDRMPLKLGLTSTLTFDADPLKRLELSLAYWHQFDLANSFEGSDLTEATLSVRIDESGNFLFTIGYRTGNVPLTDQETNLLTAGVSFRL